MALETVDVTLPGRDARCRTSYPNVEEIEDSFYGMSYQVVEGPESGVRPLQLRNDEPA